MNAVVTMRLAAAAAVLAGAAACFPARLPARPAVQGRVTSGGRPVAGAAVAVSEVRGDSACARARGHAVTDAEGRFLVQGRRGWVLVPLLGIADGRFAWNVCVAPDSASAPMPAYTGGRFGGLAAPRADSVACAVAPGGGVRCRRTDGPR